MKEIMKESKVIIVTGGSKGIGAEMVKQLAQIGHKVVLNYYKSEKEALKIKEELEKEGINILIFKADVSKRKEVQELIKFTLRNYKKIDVLINNAGISQEQMFTDIKDEDWNLMMNTNLNSAFYTSQEVLNDMISRKEGLIINISSIWGLTGGSCEVAYSTAKAGMIGMTKALAKELGPSNIRVNCIAPGIINTDMNKHLTREEIDTIKDEIPLEKIGNPVDVVRCIKWLIEDKYTTGQVISINGGWYI